MERTETTGTIALGDNQFLPDDYRERLEAEGRTKRALDDLLQAVVNAGPPTVQLPGGVASNRPFYEARVPVELVIAAEEALGVSRRAVNSPANLVGEQQEQLTRALRAAPDDDKHLGAAQYVRDG